ncbi:hypothetical protein FOPG_19900 [Fusarium oxysporum f. sp. conglutinans race 2 54008]|uniref:Uncharacterized protein n=1 Tax=Fusarium oxysporum f. sp. conglutinans race 2 54008 TaxID=1089457 RepID=X0GKL1_FUSOX|nr:hypothetical protein FOPG_19900 [Fusarium oxysporum f. sp. conglutinans race 2 54008]
MKSTNPRFEAESSTKPCEMLSARSLCRAPPLLSNHNRNEKTVTSTSSYIAKMVFTLALARVPSVTSPRGAR